MVVDELAPRRSGLRERAELGVAHGPWRAFARARATPACERSLGSDPKPSRVPSGGVEGDLDPDAVGLRALGLLDAVAGDMGGVVEPRQERCGCRRRRPRPPSRPAAPATKASAVAHRAGELGGAGHYGRRTAVTAVGYFFWCQPGMPSSRITMFR